MKLMRVLFVVVALTACAAAATAQPGGYIGLFSDAPGYSDCNLVEMLYATNTIYIVHTLASSGNSAQFKIVNGWQGPIAGPINFYSNLTLGDVYTGIAVTYVGCKALPYLLGTLSFIPVTPTPPCTAWFWVVPDPAVESGEIEVVDCNYNRLTASGGNLSVNGTLQCQYLCGGYGPPVPTDATSWGKVKASYR